MAGSFSWKKLSFSIPRVKFVFIHLVLIRRFVATMQSNREISFAYQAGDGGRCRCYGRNNPSCDFLGFETISIFDTVHCRAKILYEKWTICPSSIRPCTYTGVVFVRFRIVFVCFFHLRFIQNWLQSYRIPDYVKRSGGGCAKAIWIALSTRSWLYTCSKIARSLERLILNLNFVKVASIWFSSIHL